MRPLALPAVPLQDLLDAVEVRHPEHGYRRLIAPELHQVLRHGLIRAFEREKIFDVRGGWRCAVDMKPDRRRYIYIATSGVRLHRRKTTSIRADTKVLPDSFDKFGAEIHPRRGTKEN